MSALLPSPAGSASAAWRVALPASALVVAALLLLYGETFVAMVRIWSRSDTFAHAFLVAPISAWLVWRRRFALAAIAPRPAPWLLLPMALVALMWLLADLAGVNAAAQFAATALLVLAVPALLGTRFARAITFPLAFLFFMVPIGEFTTATMMEWTADVTVWFIRLIGIPVYREGLQFVIPSGTWSVVEACSGVRYLIASFMVGTLFAYLSYSSPTKRLAFGVVALAVPIVANWMRAIMIVLLGHYSGNKIAVGVDHLIYGWVFFGVVIMLMFWIGAKWSDPEDEPTPRPAGAAPADAPLALAWRPWLTAGAATIAVLALPQWASWKLDGQGGAAPTLRLPAATAVAEDGRFPTPSFVKPSAEASTAFESPAGVTKVHVAYYRHQGYDNKLSNSENQLVRSDSKDWAFVSQERRTLAVDGNALPVRAAELRGGALHVGSTLERVHLRQFLWVGGRIVATPTEALLHSLLGRLLGRGDDAASIVFMMRGGDVAATSAALDAASARHLPALLESLEATRSQR